MTQQNSYEFLEEVTTEENLRNNLNGLSDLPEEPKEAPMLHAKRKEFTEDEIEELDNLSGQKSLVIDNHMIVGKLDKPLTINVEGDWSEIEPYIWNYDQYVYYDKDEESNTLILFQQLDDHIFFNQSGVLLIHLNEKGEMTHYIQTLLLKTDEQPEKETLRKPLELISLLYDGGQINPGDEITDQVLFGYHNLLPLPSGVQVLAPTWKIEINNEKVFLVNAIESHHTQRDPETFIGEMMEQIKAYLTKRQNVPIKPINDEWEQEELQEFMRELLQDIDEGDGEE